jgi:hypothetical protein
MSGKSSLVKNFTHLDCQPCKIAAIYTDAFQPLTTGSDLCGYFGRFARRQLCRRYRSIELWFLESFRITPKGIYFISEAADKRMGHCSDDRYFISLACQHIAGAGEASKITRSGDFHPGIDSMGSA